MTSRVWAWIIVIALLGGSGSNQADAQRTKYKESDVKDAGTITGVVRFEGKVDCVVVYALDRIARNAVEGMVLLGDWLKRGVRLVVITMQMDFSGEVGQMIASLLLHIAQMERTRIRERQAAGIAAARANGKRWGGRKQGTGLKADPVRVRELRTRGLTNREIATALGVSTRTVIRMAERS